MAELRIDTDDLAVVASSLASEPRALRAQAQTVSEAARRAAAAVATDAPALATTIDRFRLLTAHGLDAVAEAAGALAGDLATVAGGTRSLEQAAARAFADRGHGTGLLE